MSTLLPRIVCVSLVLLSGAVGAAQQQPPSAAETRNMLLRGEFATLDSRFGALQAAYAAGRLSDEDLRDAFRAFYDVDPGLEGFYSRWIASSPNSYVAHLARGIYYKKRSLDPRGLSFTPDTPSEEFEAVKAEQQIAEQEFRESLKLDPKPILSYAHFMDIYTLRGDGINARKLLDQGLAIDPHALVVREKYLGSLQTRWGGSPGQMRAFVAECRDAGLPQEQLAKLNAILREEEAWIAQHVDGDLDAAAQAYRSAALLDSNDSCAHCGPLFKRAQILQRQKQYAKSIDAASAILSSNPDDIDTLNLRGLSYFQLGKGAEARADLLRAANLGNAWAQTMLGKMLLDGNLIPADRPQAIYWLTFAAKNLHYAPAIELLSRAGDTNQPLHFKP